MKTNKPILPFCFMLALMIFFAVSSVLLAEKYEYDTQGRLIKVTYDDDSSITYAYDEVGNLMESEMFSEHFFLPLDQGWRLISFPIQPSNPSPEAALSSIDGKYDSIWEYNPDAGWSIYLPGGASDLSELGPGKGYWLKMDALGNLDVQGTASESTAIFLKGGEWNLVGYNSLVPRTPEACMQQVVDKIDSVWGYSPENGWSIYKPGASSNLELMKPGYGYWIKADEDCIWDVNITSP